MKHKITFDLACLFIAIAAVAFVSGMAYQGKLMNDKFDLFPKDSTTTVNF